MKVLPNMTISRAIPRVSPATARFACDAASARDRRCAGRKSSVTAAQGGPGPVAHHGRRWPAAALATALALTLAGAAGAADKLVVTPEQRAAADKVAANGVALSDLSPTAPSSYTIKRGDTLWSISTLFLKSPWRWPELWGMNHAQIRNPHLIYPGQTLLLVKTADGRAQLVLAGANTTATTTPAATPAVPAVAPPAPEIPTEKRSPQARDLGAGERAAIASVPNNQIEPFLSRPSVITPEDLAAFPRIVATQEDRVYVGNGDTAYARGIDAAAQTGVASFHILRPASPLYDPDDFDRKHPIAYEASYLGTARLEKGGDVGTLRIIESKQEIGVGDSLVPITHQELINYVPHRPEQNVAARIVAVYGGVKSVGAGNIVALNRGGKDGLEIGSVLTVLHDGQTIVDRTDPARPKVKMPDESIGNLFVFRIFDNISYALLVTASGPIKVGDRAVHPESAAVAAPAATDAPAAATGATP